MISDCRVKRVCLKLKIIPTIPSLASFLQKQDKVVVIVNPAILLIWFMSTLLVKSFHKEDFTLISLKVCRRETPNLAYPPAFKLEVALHAKKYSQYAAAKIFSVARR